MEEKIKVEKLYAYRCGYKYSQRTNEVRLMDNEKRACFDGQVMSVLGARVRARDREIGLNGEWKE